MRGRPNQPADAWEHVDTSGDCWLWTGAPNTNGGYGRFDCGGKRHQAHRFIYELVVGPIPAGKLLDHTCHVPACVNPAHLQPVTTKGNAENRAGPRAGSVSGVRGVTWDRKRQRWEVRVRHHGKLHHGGRYTSLGDAETAAVALRNRLHTNNLRDRGGGPPA